MSKDISKISGAALTIIAFIGLLISIELCVVYYNANFNANSVPSFCSVNEVIDCDAVSTTTFSRFLEVPLSLWGLGFYAFILFILLFPFQKFEIFKEFKHPKGFVSVLATLSVIVSLVMAYISSFVIQKICVLCHALYLINLLLFIFCFAGHSLKDLYKNAFIDVKNILSDKRWALTAIFAILSGIVLLFMINIYKPFTPKSAISLTENLPPGYEIGKIGNVLGAKEPKIIIKEFTDFECPFCAISNRMMIQLASEVDGVRIEHYDYPLNSKCNFTVGGTMHKNGCITAYYARAARKQGKFWDMATLLFENQKNLSEKRILELAMSIDLDIDKLKKDAHDPMLRKEVLKDVRKAKALDITGTPSYVIGIKIYEGIIPYPELKQMIKESL